MADHVVPNLEAALDLAERWKTAGTHRWFRGQNQPWPLRSSLGRRQLQIDFDREGYSERLSRVCHWIGELPELRHLLEAQHVHAFFAVLQHYGVPTHYVDFTVSPQVAAFFAGVGDDAKPGTQGCIVAVDPDEWVGFLKQVETLRGTPPESRVEKVEVQVPNLWRMELQSGHFVYLPIDKVERLWAPDRILFTHDGSLPTLGEEDVYPSRKSALEERLDELFTLELGASSHRHLEELARKLSATGRFHWVHAEPRDVSRWLRSGAGPHASWGQVSAEWHRYPNESPHDRHQAIDLPLRLDEPVRSAAAWRSLVRRASMHIATHAAPRDTPVRWRLVGRQAQRTAEWVAHLERSVNRAWDGARRHPYTDVQLAAVVGGTVALASCRNGDSTAYGPEDFAPLLREPISIELASRRGASARGVVSTRAYLEALRADLKDVLVPELLTRPRQQLRQVLGPNELFEFDALIQLFARQVIPTQALMQRPDIAIFFAPTAINTFGAP